MPSETLTEFLDLLADQQELVRITEPVDAAFEAAEIVRRLHSEGRRGAVLFEQVKGRRFPLLFNALGTDRRFQLALGVPSFEEVTSRLATLLDVQLPSNWFEALQLVPRLAELANWPTQTVDRGLCQQVVKLGRDVNLEELPIPQCGQAETLPVINSGQAFVSWCPLAPTEASTTSGAMTRRRASRPLMQVRDRQSLLVHWTPHDPEWQWIEQYRLAGQPMPVVIALGGDPLLTYAVGAPLPAFADPLVFAGFLRQKPVELVKARQHDLLVPAQAEFILEGHIDPHRSFDTAPPLGLPTGFYSLPESVPVMTVTAHTHRANPVWPSMLLSAESDWDVFERANDRFFFPLLKLAIPEVVAVHRPCSGRYRHFLFVSIQKSYAFQARKVMHALWGHDRFSRTKFIVVVDADIDVRDEAAVWFEVGANTHPSRDTVFSEGTTDMLDHASPSRGAGSRLGIDATRKRPDEGHSRPWPEEF